MNHQQQKSPRGAQRPFRFYIASLGCPKNTVDSNAMGLLLQRAGYEATLDPYEADVLIVNTCGFIELARQESFETLQALAAQTRPEQRLIAAGCWAQRSPDWLLDALPALDAVIGTRTWPGIVPWSSSCCRGRGRALDLRTGSRAPLYVAGGGRCARLRDLRPQRLPQDCRWL